MKNRIFEQNEKEILERIISQSIIDYKSEKYSQIGKKIITKLRLDISHLTPNEKLTISSFTQNWINKNEISLDKLYEKYVYKNPLNYLNINLNDRNLMNDIDLVNSIRDKVKAEKRYINYQDILSKIERMKNINDIYLSEKNGKPYKIAFVDYDKNEFLKWEFELSEDFEKTSFFKTTKSNLKETKNLFTLELNKQETLKIFESYIDKKNNKLLFCEDILR